MNRKSGDLPGAPLPTAFGVKRLGARLGIFVCEHSASPSHSAVKTPGSVRRETEMSEKTEMLFVAIALVASATVGCSDDDGTSDTGMPPVDTGTGDATPDAMDSGVVDSGDDAATDSATDGGTPSCDEADLDHLLVVTTAGDFSRAGLGTIDLGDLSARTAAEDLPDSDSVAAASGCLGYVLSRGQGNAQVMDDADPLSVARTIDVNPAGAMGPYASNPQTIVAASNNKAYVIEAARNTVTIIDPTMSGAGAVLGEIDLTAYLAPGDTDGLVDAADAIVIDDQLFVALGNYWFDSSFAIHFEGSVLAVIDTTTDMLVDVDSSATGTQGIDLAGENPWRGLQHDPETDVLFVGSSGDSFAADGQIETIDLATLEVMGSVVTEAELSGEINGFAVLSPTRVVVLLDQDLVTIDPTVDFIVPENIASEMDGLLVHQDTIWAWARSGEEPGLASFDASTGMETTPAAGRFNFADLLVFAVVPVP